MSRPLRDDRAVSSVIGVVLVVAITVIVAALVGAASLGVTDRIPDGEPTNAAYFEPSYDPGDGSTNASVSVTVGGASDGSLGEDTYVYDDSGNRVKWTAVWSNGPTLDAGETLVIDGKGADDSLDAPCDRETYRVVKLSDRNQTSETIFRFTSGTADGSAKNC